MSVRLPELPEAMGYLEQIIAMGAANPWKRVRDLTLLSQKNENSSFELCRFFPLLTLTPNVTTLRLAYCNLAWIPDTQPNQERRLRRYVPRGLKTLEIWQICIQHESMGILLAHLTNLETLVYYSREDLASAEARYREVTAKQLMHHLLPSKATLRKVRMVWHTHDSALVTRDDFAEFLYLRDDTGLGAYDGGAVQIEEHELPDTQI